MDNTASQPVLSSLYTDLNKFGQNQDYERALKTANKILQEAPTETAAFQCKVVCLIKLDKFSEALNLINKEKALSSGLKFEKAYCEYRLNRTQESLATLRSVSSLDYRCKELLAQVLYRLEEYAECYELYKDLVKNSEDEFDEERETNLAAVLASLQLWDGVDQDDPGLRENSYELCYNHSCFLVGKGNFKGAEEKLKKAEALCKSSFADDPDVTEEEVEEELAIMRVQLAYVLQKQGRIQEATQLYNQVQKTKPSDVGLMAVVSNNIVTINKDQNVFDSKKKMKVATADNLKQKLSSKQKELISINQCLLHMYTNQSDQCVQLADQLKNKYPDIETPVLIEAAHYARDKQMPKAIQVLEVYSKAHPEHTLSVLLATAQLYLGQGSVYQACDCLKALGDLQYKLGVVSALVTLYLSQEDHNAASDIFTRALDWYKKRQPGSEELVILMRASAYFQLKNGNAKETAKMLEELRKVNPDDPRLLAQLIAAYSKFDPAKAQSISRQLPTPEDVSQTVDVDNLETTFSSLGPKYMKKLQKAEPSPKVGDELLLKKKKKKKKKGKLPKNYEPGSTPDPERWLPKRERSYYRGKRKDKKKDIGKGTQGATTSSADIDSSKPSSAPGSDVGSPRPGSSGDAPSPQGATQQGPRQQKPVHTQKKKKKKGGGNKW
ncbi:hypothetical protein CHS0354_015281 [Potamilus streckersoni]|uniref:Signal recognition particle subunit SRP72 n=1 Tax=Potamilus streckersoni TaxID=2493646 RepID=A0AAE0RZQ8_9BIVA|nr:hypothetical protein CHS0354_015281 [Potamilus streckersoni]